MIENEKQIHIFVHICRKGRVGSNNNVIMQIIALQSFKKAEIKLLSFCERYTETITLI